MSETSAPTPAEVPKPQPPAQAPVVETKSDETDWVAEARKWEQRAKDNKSAADELAALKQAQMTELEKAQAAAAKLQQEAEQARAESLRLRIALKHGISDDDAATFLTATDEETLNRQAERLAALAAAQSGAPATPKPDRTQGGSGAPLALNSDGLEQALRSKLGI